MKLKPLKGQAFLEMLLIIPLVFTLVIGVVIIGLAMSYKMKVEGIARESTRAIVKNTGNGSIQVGLTRVQEVAGEYGLDPAKLDVVIEGVRDDLTPARGGTVKAKVTYRFKLLGFTELELVGENRERIECFRYRDDDNSGGTCLPPGEME
jgi:Flp pilus assembly protein TadG